MQISSHQRHINKHKQTLSMTCMIRIEVETQEDANYILEHLQTQNPVIEEELEELDDN